MVCKFRSVWSLVRRVGVLFGWFLGLKIFSMKKSQIESSKQTQRPKVKEKKKNRRHFRIVVVGDAGTGKSTLIYAAKNRRFRKKPLLKVIPPFKISAKSSDYGLSSMIVDTCSKGSDGSISENLKKKLLKAHAVVVTYACDNPPTYERVTDFWLPEIKSVCLQHKRKMGVIVVGCRQDLKTQFEDPHYSWHLLMDIQFPQMVDVCLEMSTKLETRRACYIFSYYAQKARLQPVATLRDPIEHMLTHQAERALLRIFSLTATTNKGFLSEKEFAGLQERTWKPKYELVRIEMRKFIADVEDLVKWKFPVSGYTSHGMSLAAFVETHLIYLSRGFQEYTWNLLKAFGYDREVRFKGKKFAFAQHPDEIVVLSPEAKTFLADVFLNKICLGRGDTLSPFLVDYMFLKSKDSPWNDPRYKAEVERTETGGLALNGYLAMWALMAFRDPVNTLADLIEHGYLGDPGSALHLRRSDEKEQSSKKDVLLFFIFGPENTGKSLFMDSLVARPFSGSSGSTNKEDKFAASVIDQFEGTKKTLIFREIVDDEVEDILSKKKALAACDAAIFVYDCCETESLDWARELIVQVCDHGKEKGLKVPCIAVATRSDLVSNAGGLDCFAEGVFTFKFDTLDGRAKIAEFKQKIVSVAEAPQVRDTTKAKRRRSREKDRLRGKKKGRYTCSSLVGRM